MHLLLKHPELWGFRQKSWTRCVLPPLLLSRKEGVQCLLVSVIVTGPGSEDTPTQLLETGGKKMFFLMSFSLYCISSNFPRTVHGEMCGCLLCCLDSWVFKSPYMQFPSMLPSQHHVCLPQRIPLWRTCHGSRWSVSSPGSKSVKPFFPCHRNFLMSPWQKKER